MLISEWTDVNGEVHKIEDMTTNHIKNCIRLIKESTKPRILQNSRSITGGFDQEWAKNDGQKYIEVFNEELRIRKEIKNRLQNDDIPKFEVDERCGICRYFRKCRKPKKKWSSESCSDWRLNSTFIDRFVSGEDYTIATRAGFYCNKRKYIAKKKKKH